ncbi:hypothetical protein TVNIR_3332 [Thioalkalivibrio nitratireducens DSM 14787]|uniref:Uncharacterized protein n=1 Tax=Thioalkalivibrio nitratireducens (strain DSM 14787 / UNIQEM 213 / ALEN2) TaxID=1255043 RepID=L0E0Z7_THIND|nr:hypothetical protein TVNIR_3332 [Thioalkalivibrio nitratireducens DSM 14787]
MRPRRISGWFGPLPSPDPDNRSIQYDTDPGLTTIPALKGHYQALEKRRGKTWRSA